MLIGGAVGDLLKFLGIHNPLFRINVEIIRTDNYYIGKKAQDELGIQYSSINTAIEAGIGICRSASSRLGHNLR